MCELLQACLWKILICSIEVAGLISGIDLEPFDSFLSPVGFCNGGIKYFLRRRPDVDTGSISPDEGDDGVISDLRLAVFEADGVPWLGGVSFSNWAMEGSVRGRSWEPMT